MAMAKRPSPAIAPSSSSSLSRSHSRSRNWSQPSSKPQPETEPGPGRDWDWDPKTNRPTTRATRWVCVSVCEIGGGDAARRQSPVRDTPRPLVLPRLLKLCSDNKTICSRLCCNLEAVAASSPSPTPSLVPRASFLARLLAKLLRAASCKSLRVKLAPFDQSCLFCNCDDDDGNGDCDCNSSAERATHLTALS